MSHGRVCDDRKNSSLLADCRLAIAPSELARGSASVGAQAWELGYALAKHRTGNECHRLPACVGQIHRLEAYATGPRASSRWPGIVRLIDLLCC